MGTGLALVAAHCTLYVVCCISRSGRDCDVQYLCLQGAYNSVEANCDILRSHPKGSLGGSLELLDSIRFYFIPAHLR